MSQQESMSEFQQRETIQHQDESYRAKAHNQRRKSGMPKQDHPSAYDETIPPYSYQAQDRKKTTQQTTQQQSRSQHTWKTYVPEWARPPQRSRKQFSWAKFVIIALMLLFAIPLLLKLLVLLFALLVALMFGLMILLLALFFGFVFIRTNGRHRWW